MSDIRVFDSMEEMHEWMARQTEAANDNLHPVQRDLTWGSYWVRFVDVRARIVEFGRVLTHEEAAERWGEEPGLDENMERGYLYSEAHSLMGSDIGDTHRWNAWPIEERLFEAAKAVDWQIDRLDEAMKLLLEIAFRQRRVHEMTVGPWGE